ncbi:hypothetical protein Krac_2830 [Ktedonobacter racemifer DSM 44963]|uniref:Uncharacterized protein n=1 Tax=Ktedonobacter racemifer DSM 44963 TaxID=485913 RepID=D6TZR5_KTERA|nr:hypothetical protein Krac_2830 [Ktedonobacter racemifer DSM 44963]
MTWLNALNDLLASSGLLIPATSTVSWPAWKRGDLLPRKWSRNLLARPRGFSP